MTTRTSIRSRIPLLFLGLGAVLVAVALIAGFAGGGDSTSNPPTVPDAGAAPTGPPVPATEFEFFDGTTATLAHYEGRPLVVNFWASWCPSCVAELSAAFVPVQERLGDDVSFLGLNIQDERSKALDLVDETGALFDLAEDPRGDLFAAFGGLGMPFTVLVSPTGEILHEHNGPLTEGQLTGLIREFLLS